MKRFWTNTAKNERDEEFGHILDKRCSLLTLTLFEVLFIIFWTFDIMFFILEMRGMYAGGGVPAALLAPVHIWR